tara:strand:+ start:763 stop:933 length:171 start_codon:yes stop_codon:yes gene_type:complete
VVLNARGEIGCQPVLLFGTFFLQEEAFSFLREDTIASQKDVSDYIVWNLLPVRLLV